MLWDSFNKRDQFRERTRVVRRNGWSLQPFRRTTVERIMQIALVLETICEGWECQTAASRSPSSHSLFQFQFSLSVCLSWMHTHSLSSSFIYLSLSHTHTHTHTQTQTHVRTPVSKKIEMLEKLTLLWLDFMVSVFLWSSLIITPPISSVSAIVRSESLIIWSWSIWLRCNTEYKIIRNLHE